MPFSTGPTAKGTVAMLPVVMIGAFAIPFLAAKFSINKNGREVLW